MGMGDLYSAPYHKTLAQVLQILYRFCYSGPIVTQMDIASAILAELCHLSVTIMPTPTLVIWPKEWQMEQARLY